MTEKVYRSDNACVTIQCDMLQLAHEILSGWSQVTYCSLGLEVAPTTGKKHLQCYIEFKNTMRATTFWKKINMPGSYFKSRIGTQKHAIDYTQKDGNFLTYGDPKLQQGERTDLSDIITAIKGGMKEHELSLHFVDTYARMMKWVQRMIQLHGNTVEHAKHTLAENCINLQLHPIPFDNPAWCGSACVGGNAGVGKTDYGLSHFKNPLIVSHIDKLKFFNPNFHDGIVFDDMSFIHFPLSAQKHLLDWSNDREINVKHDIVHIPKHTRKIFTYNIGEFPFDESNSAIRDRLYSVQTTKEVSLREMPSPKPFTLLDEEHIRNNFM